MVFEHSAFMVVSPLAIANKYHDHQTNQPKSVRYRLILVRASDLDWLKGDRLKDIQAQARAGHNWIPAQQLPYNETILYAYAADRTNRPTYVCLPSGLYNARAGRVLAQSGPDQEITPLPGIYFFDGWRVHPTLAIPANLPSTKEAPVLSRSLYRSHVLSAFFGPVLGAMMKQVCWHSRRSEALRGSPRPARGQASDVKRNGTRTKRGSRGLESK